MKILKSCGSPSWGGLEIYTLITTEELIKSGFDLKILCLPGSNIYNNAFKKKIETLPVLSKGLRRLKSIFKLKKYLKKNKIDVIHSHLSNDLWVLVPALKLSGCKTKLILSKGMESGVSKNDIFHQWLYNRVDVIVPVSNFIKKNVLATCPVKEDKVLVIHDAIQLEKFNPDLFNKEAIRNELGFNGSDIIIGMFGRMSPGKGHEIFFECAKTIIDSNLKDNVKFIVVGGASFGEDEYANKLIGQAESLGLKNYITFTGYRADIPKYLSAIDILAFPSNEESFGGTIPEAMAMKLPVAAFNSGGVPDIIIDGETGILVPKNDTNLLTTALKKLISDPELRTTYGNNGRRRVEQNFDMKQYIQKFEKLYAS